MSSKLFTLMNSPNCTNPHFLKNLINSVSFFIAMFVILPIPQGIKINGLCDVILESSCLNEPAAAFLGFEKTLATFFMLSFRDLNLLIGNITSPLISTNSGIFFPPKLSGTLFIVFIFLVICSPIFPSPLVAPTSKNPFL